MTIQVGPAEAVGVAEAPAQQRLEEDRPAQPGYKPRSRGVTIRGTRSRLQTSTRSIARNPGCAGGSRNSRALTGKIRLPSFEQEDHPVSHPPHQLQIVGNHNGSELELVLQP